MRSLYARLGYLIASLGFLAGCDGCGSASQQSSAQAGPIRASARPFAATPSAANTAQIAGRSAAADASAGAGSSGSAIASAASEQRELTWTWEKSPVGPMNVVVLVPARKPTDPKLPVLVAMHGRGEAFKGPVRGARGWIDDYWLGLAIERLHAPPLNSGDLQGFVDAERLARINQSLASRPYRGLIVVCPYTPDILAGDRPFNAALPLATFIVDELLPRVYRETPALGTPDATGIDGVSLGGRAALLVGLERPKAFGAIATLQAAFDSADAPELARRARNALEQNQKLKLRLLTSDEDYFLNANRNIARALQASGIAHELVVVPGPHDYPFNRGPGAYEMLLFHDRVLRAEPPL